MYMIKPENYQKLLDDVVKKTGLQIIDCKVGRINFLENWANVKIYYKKENPL